MEHAQLIRLAKTDKPEPERMAWLARTKLQPPPLRSGVIPRRRLIEAGVRCERTLEGWSYRRCRGAPADRLE